LTRKEHNDSHRNDKTLSAVGSDKTVYD